MAKAIFPSKVALANSGALQLPLYWRSSR